MEKMRRKLKINKKKFYRNKFNFVKKKNNNLFIY